MCTIFFNNFGFVVVIYDISTLSNQQGVLTEVIHNNEFKHATCSDHVFLPRNTYATYYEPTTTSRNQFGTYHKYDSVFKNAFGTYYNHLFAHRNRFGTYSEPHAKLFVGIKTIKKPEL